VGTPSRLCVPPVPFPPALPRLPSGGRGLFGCPRGFAVSPFRVASWVAGLSGFPWALLPALLFGGSLWFVLLLCLSLRLLLSLAVCLLRLRCLWVLPRFRLRRSVLRCRVRSCWVRLRCLRLRAAACWCRFRGLALCRVFLARCVALIGASRLLRRLARSLRRLRLRPLLRLLPVRCSLWVALRVVVGCFRVGSVRSRPSLSARPRLLRLLVRLLSSLAAN